MQAQYNRRETVFGHSLIHNNKLDGIIRLNNGILSRRLERCSESVGEKVEKATRMCCVLCEAGIYAALHWQVMV